MSWTCVFIEPAWQEGRILFILLMFEFRFGDHTKELFIYDHVLYLPSNGQFGFR